MISVVDIPSDYSNSTYALVAFAESSNDILDSGLPQELQTQKQQSAPDLLAEPLLEPSGAESDDILSNAASTHQVAVSGLEATPPSKSSSTNGAAPSDSGSVSVEASPIEPKASASPNPLTSVPSPSLQFVQAISSWSSGISDALKFDAPLIAVVQIQNPRSLISATAEAIDSKTMTSVKGGGTLKIHPDHQRQDCLAADEMMPKPAFDTVFQVQVKGQTIANLPTQTQAKALAQQIEQTLQTSGFNPETLQAAIENLVPLGKVGETTLFQIDSALAAQFDRNPELLAISWINNLRLALEVSPIPIAEAQIQMHALTLTPKQLKGNASWYDPLFAGSPTATGETFDPIKMTAAHPTLPFDTYLKVTNQQTQDSVIVRINDRGPYLHDRSLDLSNEAARCLNSEMSGVVPYEAVVLENPQAQVQAAEAPLTTGDSLSEGSHTH